MIIGIPVPFTVIQTQAEAKLLPGGGVFGPVAATSAAKHELARVIKKIEKRELKIQTDPEYGVGSRRRTALDAEMDVLWFRHRYIRHLLNLPA